MGVLQLFDGFLLKEIDGSKLACAWVAQQTTTVVGVTQEGRKERIVIDDRSCHWLNVALQGVWQVQA